jgi:hypothetical protein
MPPRVIATLLFVRRNDILLQRGMALQAIPLPSLGVSSLDLGRSFNRTALFLYRFQDWLFSGSAGDSEARRSDDQRLHHAFKVAAHAVKSRRFLEARLIHVKRAVDLDL